jgi:uncharacterized cupin superfamily protein
MKAKHACGHEPYEYYKYEATKDAGLKSCCASIYEIPPLKSNYPYHYHMKNEEIFYIISGRGILETDEGLKTVSAGDMMLCPAGEKGAHKITNTSGTEKLVYIDFDTANMPEAVVYPHSGKIGVKTGAAKNEYYKRDTQVDYYTDE